MSKKHKKRIRNQLEDGSHHRDCGYHLRNRYSDNPETSGISRRGAKALL